MFKKIFILFALIIPFISPAFANTDEIEVIKDNGVYIFKIPLKKYANKIKPYVAPELTTTSEVFHNKDLGFKLVVNGGFFDPVNGAGVSEVIIDGKVADSPYSNLSMIESLNEQNRIEQVLNRSELRIFNKGLRKETVFDIKEHFADIDEDATLIHSIQAGPMILPELRLEKESFVKYDNNKITDLAVNASKRRERTIIGLKKEMLQDYFYIIIFSSRNRVSLVEAYEYCKNLGLSKALAMDGGASTSINYDTIEIISAKDNSRRVKSFIVIEN